MPQAWLLWCNADSRREERKMFLYSLVMLLRMAEKQRPRVSNVNGHFFRMVPSANAPSGTQFPLLRADLFASSRSAARADVKDCAFSEGMLC